MKYENTSNNCLQKVWCCTIWGYSTIKIALRNKDKILQVVLQCSTILGWGTNRVNTVVWNKKGPRRGNLPNSRLWTSGYPIYMLAYMEVPSKDNAPVLPLRLVNARRWHKSNMFGRVEQWPRELNELISKTSSGNAWFIKNLSHSMQCYPIGTDLQTA